MRDLYKNHNQHIKSWYVYLIQSTCFDCGNGSSNYRFVLPFSVKLYQYGF